MCARSIVSARSSFVNSRIFRVPRLLLGNRCRLLGGGDSRRNVAAAAAPASAAAARASSASAWTPPARRARASAAPRRALSAPSAAAPCLPARPRGGLGLLQRPLQRGDARIRRRSVSQRATAASARAVSSAAPLRLAHGLVQAQGRLRGARNQPRAELGSPARAASSSASVDATAAASSASARASSSDATAASLLSARVSAARSEAAARSSAPGGGDGIRDPTLGPRPRVSRLRAPPPEARGSRKNPRAPRRAPTGRRVRRRRGRRLGEPASASANCARLRRALLPCLVRVRLDLLGRPRGSLRARRLPPHALRAAFRGSGRANREPRRRLRGAAALRRLQSRAQLLSLLL